MNQAALLAYHDEATKKMRALCVVKNADYADAEAASANAFKNFTLIEAFDVATTEQGFFTRMTDKFSRIATFLKRGILKVKDESVEDTLLDLANYCILFAAFLHSKRAADAMKKPASEELLMLFRTQGGSQEARITKRGDEWVLNGPFGSLISNSYETAAEKARDRGFFAVGKPA